MGTYRERLLTALPVTERRMQIAGVSTAVLEGGFPGAKVAGRLMRQLGLPAIAPEEPARIAVPTSLVWGRHDRANRLRIAQAASRRYGWPLHIIEDCADDPARDRPAAFREALHASLATVAVQSSPTARKGAHHV